MNKPDDANKQIVELTFALAELVAVTGYDMRENEAWERAKKIAGAEVTFGWIITF